MEMYAGVYCTSSLSIYTSHRNYACWWAMFSKALNYEKPFSFNNILCILEDCLILTEVLQP